MTTTEDMTMGKPKLLLRTGQFWTIEAPVRDGGWAIPVHGVDAEGFALDPHDEIAPQREKYRRIEEAIDHGADMDEIRAILAEYEHPPCIA